MQAQSDRGELDTLALALSSWGRPQLAVQAAEAACAAFRTWQPDDERTLTTISNYGAILGEAGHWAKSSEMAQEAWDRRKLKAGLGEEHPDTLTRHAA